LTNFHTAAKWSLAVLLAWSGAAAAQWLELRFVDPRLHWRTLETAHFSVHFAEQYRAQARIAAALAERVYPRITARLAWEPRARTHLVLLDSADFANGSATPVPFNRTSIFLSPPDQGELLQNREWLELVLTHELFHIVHLDKASGAPLNLRGVLGRLLPFFPNVLQPPWIVEGLAVEAESEAAPGYGRLGHSFFEGMMRAEVGRGLRKLAEVNAEGRGFPLNRDYLYGSYFFAFVRERYGEGAVRRMIDEYSDNVVPFRVQSNPRLATGKSMDQLWSEYQDWLRARFAPRAAPTAEGELLGRAFFLSAPVLGAGGERWFLRGDGYARPALMRQAPGEPTHRVGRTEEDTRLTAMPEGGVLMSELDICRNHNLVYNLYRVDARGRRERLDECGRLRFAAPLAGGRIAAARVLDGTAEIVLLEGGSVTRTFYRTMPGESVTGLAAHENAVVITTLRAGRWSVVEVGGTEPRVLAADAAVKHSPRFDAQGELYFVADYGGSYDVWSLRGATLARWSRTANGVKEISAPLGRELLLTTIEPDGDALRLLALPETPLETRPAPVEGRPSGRLEEAQGREMPYSPWPSLRPTAWVPIVQVGEGVAAFGVAVFGQDALGVHEYVAAPIVEVRHRELLGQLDYLYDGRHGVRAERTLTVSGTQGGQELTLRENAQWVSVWRHLTLNRRFYWGGGAALEQETQRDRFGTTLRTQDERVLGLVGGVDTRRSHWLSEGPSEGQQLRLFAETSSRLGGAYSGNIYRGDWRGHLTLGRSALGLRWNEAWGQRAAEPFELGGSRSDDYIPLPVLNQRNFALRGYGTGESALTGHRARLATVEWRTPLADVDRHLMVPPLGLNRLALNLFVDVGAAWEHGDRPDYHRGVGAELVSEPRFGYLFGGFQLRAGIAKGVDAPGRTLAYLRVGRSF
jgi:hypothetical protein